MQEPNKGNVIRQVLKFETHNGDTIIKFLSVDGVATGADKILANRVLSALVSSEQFPRIVDASEIHKRRRRNGR